MTKPIKVMHVINNLEIGGAETILANLNQELLAYDDIDSFVVSLEGHGPLADVLRKAGVRVKEFNFRLFVPRIHRFDPYFRLRLFLYALKEKPDIIHGHLLAGEDFAKVLGWLLRKPVVTTLHDTMIYPGRKAKFLNRFVTRAIAVSESVAEHLRRVYGFPADRIVTIPNGIHMERFAGSAKVYDPDHPVFVYVGRVLRGKGIKHAMEALSWVWAEHPNLEFRIWGKKVFDEDWDFLTGLAREKGWDFVKFMGPTDDVPGALAEADFFILPSASEGFSIAVLEAAAASKPIIATAVGAIPDMVDDRHSGYLVPYGHIGAIVDAARRLVRVNDVETFGKASRAVVAERFNIHQVARQLVELYRSLDA